MPRPMTDAERLLGMYDHAAMWRDFYRHEVGSGSDKEMTQRAEKAEKDYRDIRDRVLAAMADADGGNHAG